MEDGGKKAVTTSVIPIAIYDPLKEARESFRKTGDTVIPEKKLNIELKRTTPQISLKKDPVPLNDEKKNVKELFLEKPKKDVSEPVISIPSVKPVIEDRTLNVNSVPFVPRTVPRTFGGQPEPTPTISKPVIVPIPEPISVSIPEPILVEPEPPVIVKRLVSEISPSFEDDEKKKIRKIEFEKAIQPLKDIIQELNTMNHDFEEFCKQY